MFSIFSPRIGFTVFFKRGGIWHAFSRGRFFRVASPTLQAMEYFRHFIPPSKGVVFDVGGELGFETQQFAHLVGSSGKVFVFECMPDHVEGLNRLAEYYPQVQVINRACWNVDTSLEFFIGNTPGSNSAVADAKGQHGQDLANTQTSLIVQADRLDNLWKDLHHGKPVDFLKMDIEGAEYEALEGATEMLASTRFAVIAAYHMRDGTTTACRVEEVLKSAGFFTRTDENLHVYAWR
ncbi:FkbM family methyltransferase [Synechococcus sp. Tobar12-5m-g]|uniref:FkbM family methyltransferase n=1 Tax=unclassified Synechococcus TaxID=2626047 RepID=UPI0020CD74E5|nr:MULTISPECIES: FkbM family methyltransferase [unclassified Synechococcus]MCP9773651.1 FkbM family methyltransferase [Synechococcus sp. Tobar12-5m-g]MCP9874624.1 FkbM family methyltransferase [Synechococcus sp. Cruz CV-v-12]